ENAPMATATVRMKRTCVRVAPPGSGLSVARGHAGERASGPGWIGALVGHDPGAGHREPGAPGHGDVEPQVRAVRVHAGHFDLVGVGPEAPDAVASGGADFELGR